MPRQKKQNVQLLISNKPLNVSKLLAYKIETRKAPDDKNNLKAKSKKETPLFYDRPIHKAKKHDLL